MFFSEVDGQFKTFRGELTSIAKFSTVKINFELDINSIDTQNKKRDEHLNGEAYFYSKKYPKMTFKSSSFTKEKGNQYLLKGNLHLRRISQPVTFQVELLPIKNKTQRKTQPNRLRNWMEQ